MSLCSLYHKKDAIVLHLLNVKEKKQPTIMEKTVHI